LFYVVLVLSAVTVWSVFLLAYGYAAFTHTPDRSWKWPLWILIGLAPFLFLAGGAVYYLVVFVPKGYSVIRDWWAEKGRAVAARSRR
jgi:hypothetical protein